MNYQAATELPIGVRRAGARSGILRADRPSIPTLCCKKAGCDVDNYDGQALVQGYDPPLVLTVTVTNIAAARKGWHGWVREGDIDRLSESAVTLTLLGDTHKGWKSEAGIVWGEGKNGITAGFVGRSGWERPRS